MIGVSRTGGRGCGLGGVGAARRHCPLWRHGMHPWPSVAVLPAPRAGGLPQHSLSSRRLQLVAPEKGALPPLQICNFVCFSLAGGKWTLPSPELVSSWSSARCCLPTKSLLQTSTRLYSSFPRPSLPLSSPLLTKLAREEKSDTRERKRDIFCPHPACCLVKGPQSELPRVSLGIAV